MKMENLIKTIAGDRCVLCGGRPFCIGIFAPTDPQRWGAAPGKKRFVRYVLCQKCKARQDAMERVEKVLFADLNGWAVHHE